MKFCESCGAKIDDKGMFCPKCGHKMPKEEKVKANAKEKEEMVKEVTGSTSVAPIILGVLAIIFSLLILGAPAAVIMSIIGLVIAAKSKVKDGNKTAGLVLNIIGLILSVLTLFGFILLVFFFVAVDEIDQRGGLSYIEEKVGENFTAPTTEEITGTWNCKRLTDLNGDYKATLEIKDDYTFTFGKASDIENNYVKGTYDFDESYDYTYGYTIELDGKEVVEAGQRKYSMDKDYDFAVSKISSNISGVLTDNDTESIYYCNK